LADATVGRLRGNPVADGAALVTSNLADYGFIWVVLAGFKALRAGSGRRRVVGSLVLAGFTSLAVNWVVKRLVGRQRPEPLQWPQGGSPLPVRRPSSSSFPSGHTLAAGCTAVILADSPTELATYLAIAGVVGASRVHLRAHHATDVIGGVAIGVGAGAIVRRARRAVGRRRPEPRRAATADRGE